MRRRALLFALAAAPVWSWGQQATVRRIGFLAVRHSTASNPEPLYDAFVRAMRDLGYVEGRNLAIEWRFAAENYERLPALAAELARLKVEVILTEGTPATRALQKATKTVPIVTAVVLDPVGSGFATSLSRPGGNITGLSAVGTDLSAKQVELLKSLLPKITRVAVLLNPGNSGHPKLLRNVQAAAGRFGMQVLSIEARNAEEIERGFALMAKEQVGAAIVAGDAFFLGQGAQIPALASKNRLPLISLWREFAAAGSLLSYGQNLEDYFRRAASYVDKILKGAKPGELPFEQPTKIHFAINRRTAKALGIPLSKEFLLRADEVFD